MRSPRCYLNTYYNQTREDRVPRVFQTRDAGAALPLFDALKDFGFTCGPHILNPPSENGERRPMDLSFLQRGDLVFQVTRPPKDDDEVPIKKVVRRSHTDLENIILHENGPVAEWFRTLNRKDIILTPKAIAVSQAVAGRRTMDFIQYTSSRYNALITADGDKRCQEELGAPRTAAFLVYCDQLWEDGPSYLACFGVSGLDTLIWCRALATRYRHLLLSTPFCMAEIPTDRAPRDPLTTAFVDEWPVEILGVAPPIRRTPRRCNG